ncbi:RagB/SusD family nutrient uptake outer membrane protein [Chitinophaga sancti]
MMSLYNIYGGMFDKNASPAKIARFTGLCSDELELAWESNTQGFYWNKISSGSIYLDSLWSTCYLYIRNANDVFWGCAASEKLDSVVKKQLMGEALFIRAYWFFYLTGLFGDIALPITTDAKVNALLSRTSQSKVYQQIVSDLQTAAIDLGDNYVGSDSKSLSTERNRPNRAVVSALLARVYLYMGKYEEAEEQANAIIAMDEVYELVPLDQVFLKNSKEAIWQLSPGTPNVSSINTTEGNEFIITQPPKYRIQQAISPYLLRAFDVGDQRRKHWINSYTDRSVSPAVTYYYPYKYKVNFGDDLKEYSMILRLAEIYLIRAECEVYLGHLSAALTDLNKIRQRAGLAAFTEGVLDAKGLIKAILKERQTELFTEQGHRWFDLKRTGTIAAVMSTVTPAKGGDPWNTTRELWPIPISELRRAPNLVQNPGY